MLQETHWLEGQERDFVRRWHGADIFASPALPKLGGTTGGVALVLPQHLGWRIRETMVLIKGAAIACIATWRQQDFLLVTLYATPI